MSLRITVTAVAGAFFRAMTEGERPMAKAASAAVREAANLAKAGGRANIAAAGFSRKWQNALRAKVYPPNRDSINAAALIYHKVPYAEVFEEGAIIHGKPMLVAAVAECPVWERRPAYPAIAIPRADRLAALQHRAQGQAADARRLCADD